MKKQESKIISVSVSFKDYDLDTVRYAAYAVSDAAYVFLKPAAGGAAAGFVPKSPSSAKDLAKRFKEELKDEKLRASIFAANRDLREFMILKSLAYEETPAGPRQDDSGLTPEQEKELDALIAQVESEIKKESAGNKAGDPLGITRTWEDKYGAKTGRKKK